MTPDEALAFGNKIEQDVPGINFAYRGIDCWPIVRNTLLSTALPSQKRKGLAERIHLDIRAAAGLLRGLLRTGRVDTFVLSDTKHAERIDGAVYYKYAHAIAHTARRRGQSALVGLTGGAPQGTTLPCVSLEIDLAVTVASVVAKVLSWFPWNRGVGRYVAEICAHVGACGIGLSGRKLHVLERQLVKNILFCWFMSAFFGVLLRRSRPTRCYVVCYYSAVGMALCAASRRAGIPVADVQHGISGRHMRAYGGWSKCPPRGYNTLPDEFLTWTIADARGIEEWAGVTGGRHKARCVGNLWREYFLSSGLLEQSEEEWRWFISRIAKFRCVVLITLQRNLVSEALGRVIDACPEDVCVLVRIHPTWMDGAYRSPEGLKEAHNVFVEGSSLIPLQTLMRHVDVHVTEWSASVYDALFEGVGSIVFSRDAAEYFEEFISEGAVKYVSAANEVTAALEACGYKWRFAAISEQSGPAGTGCGRAAWKGANGA